MRPQVSAFLANPFADRLPGSSLSANSSVEEKVTLGYPMNDVIGLIIGSHDASYRTGTPLFAERAGGRSLEWRG